MIRQVKWNNIVWLVSWIVNSKNSLTHSQPRKLNRIDTYCFFISIYFINCLIKKFTVIIKQFQCKVNHHFPQVCKSLATFGLLRRLPSILGSVKMYSSLALTSAFLTAVSCYSVRATNFSCSYLERLLILATVLLIV
jgi:hypothetical protein